MTLFKQANLFLQLLDFVLELNHQIMIINHFIDLRLIYYRLCNLGEFEC